MSGCRAQAHQKVDIEPGKILAVAHLLVQATQRQLLHRFLDRWTALLRAERQDRQVRWSLDVDPMELY